MIAHSMRVVAVAVWIVMLYACVSSPTVQFYTLSAEAKPDQVSGGTHAGIVIGPVGLPDVIDRPQVVIRTGANQVSLTEEHRWAESLKTSIPRVIGENLGLLLSTGKIWAYPQTPPGPVDYRVQVMIQRFESVPGQWAAIDALWTVQRMSKEHPEFKSGRSSSQQPVAGQGYDAIAAAHSRALAAVSRDIADAMRTLFQLVPE